MREWVAQLTPRPLLTVLHGVDHYFNGHLPELKDAILGALV